jgi:hypothetical protein
MITLSDLLLMGALSRLFVALERTQSGAAGRRRIGTTPVRFVGSCIGCHVDGCYRCRGLGGLH